MEGLFMTTTNNTRITFRTKFEKYLNDDNRIPITAAVESFCNWESTSALDFLWNFSLAYSTDSIEKLLNELNLNISNIPNADFTLFQNELRYQYKTFNPSFLEITVPTDCKDAFSTLENHTNSIIANVVYEHCKTTIYSDDIDDIDRILFLLESKEENNYFGGIRSLHFKMDEAILLKPFHMYIHDLLNSLYEHALSENETFKNKPLAGLGDLVKESGMELSDDIPVVFSPETKEKITKAFNEYFSTEESGKDNSKYEPLTPEMILTYKDDFSSYAENDDLNTLVPIGVLGFDLNEVMSKKEKIKHFLKAAEALSE